MNANSSSDARGSGEPLGKTRPPENDLGHKATLVRAKNAELREYGNEIRDSLQELFDYINEDYLEVDYIHFERFGKHGVECMLEVDDGKLWIRYGIREIEYLQPKECDDKESLASLLETQVLQNFLSRYISILDEKNMTYKRLAKVARKLAEVTKE